MGVDPASRCGAPEPRLRSGDRGITTIGQERGRHARRGQAAARVRSDPLAKAGGRPPLPDEQRLAATVQVRMTAAEKRDLAELAERLGRNPSAIARDALHAYVAEHRAAS